MDALDIVWFILTSVKDEPYVLDRIYLIATHTVAIEHSDFVVFFPRHGIETETGLFIPHLQKKNIERFHDINTM